jgi:hypothetical protein
MNITSMATTKRTPAPTKPKSRYKGDRRATTVVLSEALVRLAQDYFPTTRHGSMSAFMEAGLESYFRKNAPKIRKAGMTVPESVFAAR